MNNINYIHKIEERVAIIEINRPNHLNALNSELILELESLLDDVSQKEEIRSVIITGSGDKAFVAGADIKEFQEFGQKQAFDLSQIGKQKLFNKIAFFNKPVIAAINGYALGGGLELALSAHIRVATENAQLGLPECSLGLIPGYGGTQKLPKIIGLGLATEMILTGKMIKADEAYKIGLVNHVFQKEELIEKTIRITKSFNTKSPESLFAAIKSLNHSFTNDGENIESQEFSKLFETTNFKEGVAAFLEKRKPVFNK